MKRFLLWTMAALLACTMVGANAGELMLGAGDVLKISVYGNPDLNVETRVSESGNITFPLIGQVKIADMPTAMAEKKIAGMLEAGGFLKKPQVNIIVTLLQSQQVSVLGQVNHPGRYPMDGKRTLMDILALAGGVSPDGGDSVTLIRKRNGTTTKEVIDIVDMVHTANLNRDFDLAPDDVIFVERAPRFYIYGEVQRPGTFRLERSMTVMQALAAGGGLTPRGTERGMRIKRRDANGVVQVIDAKHDDVLQSDDVVYVKESLF
ncbi:MAG TPA: polysaccharide export protein EpsE [Janthinobacterium sp.]|nr:polysaccharide export protein EpsE [Janthinobacterium sp.]